MDSKFTNEELAMLEEVVREYLADLRMEIADTEDYGFREGLKKKSEILQAVIAKLEKVKQAASN